MLSFHVVIEYVDETAISIFAKSFVLHMHKDVSWNVVLAVIIEKCRCVF
jgi:hypothetical protein